MSDKLTPKALMAKADQACKSARALLNLGDANYTGELIELSDAHEIVGQAEIFVSAMHNAFMPGGG